MAASEIVDTHSCHVRLRPQRESATSVSRRLHSKYFKMAGLFCYRSLHTVRPHMPLIHFPKRFPLGKYLAYNISLYLEYFENQ
jgi:hypothetical protein